MLLSGSNMDKCRTCSEYYDGRGDGFAGQPCVYAEYNGRGNCFPYSFTITRRLRIPVACPRKCAGACGSWFAFTFLSLRARVCMPYFLEFGYTLFHSPVILPTYVHPLFTCAPSPTAWVSSEPIGCPTRCNMPKGMGIPGNVTCSKTDARLCLQSEKPAPKECPATAVCGVYFNQLLAVLVCNMAASDV